MLTIICIAIRLKLICIDIKLLVMNIKDRNFWRENMFKKLKSLLVISMLVFVGGCYDFRDSGGGSGGSNLNPDIPETEIIPDVSGVYKIYNMGHLVWVANKSVTDNFAGKIVRFMADIDMESKQFTGIQKFAGRLEGNDKTISNLKISQNLGPSIGLINVLEDGGHIENLTIVSGTITGDTYVGVFVGSASGTTTITGVTNNVDINGITYIGGIVGCNKGHLIISNSVNTGTVTAEEPYHGTLEPSRIGGLVGGTGSKSSSTLTIKNSSNSGDIVGNDNHHSFSGIGGLIGSSNDSSLIIINSSNSGTLSGQERIGGLVGSSQGSDLTISNSLNSGNISSDNQLGGIVGVYTHGTLHIDNSSNIGNIIAEGSLLGGFVGNGYKSVIRVENSFNSGDLSGSGNIGGVIGLCEKNTTTLINIHSYSKSIKVLDESTIGASEIGGIIGRLKEGTVTATNSYWLYDAGATAGTGGIDKAVGTGTLTGTSALDIAEFKDTTNIGTNFVGWDFTADTGIWIMGANYPTLRNLPVVTP